MVETLQNLNTWMPDPAAENIDKNQTLLHRAAQLGYTTVIVFLLGHDDCFVNINLKDKEGNTPLHLASARYHVHAKDLLILQGAKKELINRQDQTADQLFFSKGNQLTVQEKQRLYHLNTWRTAQHRTPGAAELLESDEES